MTNLKAKILGVDRHTEAYNKAVDAIESGKAKQHVSLFTSFYDPNLDGYKTWQTDAKEREKLIESLEADEQELFLETEQMPYALARHHAKVMDLLKRLNVPKDKWDEAIHSWNISPGYETLEWTLPSPPPFHCFDELPIIKHH